MDSGVRKQPFKVACLAIPMVHSSVLFGGYDILSTAGLGFDTSKGRVFGERELEAVIVSVDKKTVLGWNNVPITPQETLESVGVVDAIYIPAFGDVSVGLPEIDERVTRWVRECYEQRVMIAAACSGSFIVAASGILSGEKATTHWVFSKYFEWKHPEVNLNYENSMVMSGAGHSIITTGGGTLWTDLVLYIIHRLLGHEAAVHTSKLYLIDWGRDHQVVYASMEASRNHKDKVIQKSQNFLSEHLTEDDIIGKARAYTGLSERTFSRRFKAATGVSCIQYIQQLRIEMSKKLLEETEIAAEDIAYEVGYQDPTSFRRLFNRRVGISPSSYRKKFGNRWKGYKT